MPAPASHSQPQPVTITRGNPGGLNLPAPASHSHPGTQAVLGRGRVPNHPSLILCLWIHYVVSCAGSTLQIGSFRAVKVTQLT